MSLKRYAIWDRETDVITPIGEILTPEQWMERYPVARKLTTVCSAGDINGGFFGVLSQMKLMYQNEGADFSEATTDEQVLEVIEAFEDARNEAAAEAANVVTDETRIADALEDLVVLNEVSQQS